MTRWTIYTRQSLAHDDRDSTGRTMLLEGTWRGDGAGLALDDLFDASHRGLDIAAQRLAEVVASGAGEDAWVDALALRYYLVKLLRVVAGMTEIHCLAPADTVRLVAEAERDADYVAVVEQVCRRMDAGLQVAWIDRNWTRPSPARPSSRPRRWAGWAAQWLDGRLPAARTPDKPRPTGPKVVLRGNPRLLDPVCRELVDRRVRTWWLYDRFAVKSWLRWRGSGVGQLTGERWGAPLDAGEPAAAWDRLDYRGIDLGPVVGAWLRQRRRQRGARLAGYRDAVDRHFERIRPDAVVLDEDATPLARLTVAAAARWGARSLVLQHGAPCCRFGFAPVVADTFLAWGRSTADQLAAWGVERGVRIVGSPYHEALAARVPVSTSARTAKRRILLLTTVPPRDDRPDAAELNLTSQTYAGMIDRAVRAVAELDGARLTVKLHPRCPNDRMVRDALARHPDLASRVVRSGNLAAHLAETDCVLSCMSSAGIDATLFSLPVIQLLPPSAGEILPHECWGMFGTARSLGQLRALLRQALAADVVVRSPWEGDALAGGTCSAAARVVAEILAGAAPRVPRYHGIPATVPVGNRNCMSRD